MTDFKMGERVYIDQPGDYYRGQWGTIIAIEPDMFWPYTIRLEASFNENREELSYKADDLRPEVREVAPVLYQLRFVGWEGDEDRQVGVFSTKEKAEEYKDDMIEATQIRPGSLLISELALDKQFPKGA